MKYILYHDESKVDGYWHGIYLVPEERKQSLVNLLNEVNKNTGYYEPLGITDVKKTNSKKTHCAKGFLSVGIASLISDLKNKLHELDLQRRIRNERKYDYFKSEIGAKFILFREKDNRTKIEYYPDYGSIVETTFRFGLKGGMHFLGDLNDKIEIVKMHFDGYEHYHRHLDKERIIDRLYGLRGYCKISEDPNIIDDRTGNHNKENSQLLEDCKILQLTDILVGSFRSAIGFITRDLHRDFARPAKVLIDKYLQGYARMKNSRWFKGFCISQCYLHSIEGWVFEEISFKKTFDSEQTKLKFDTKE